MFLLATLRRPRGPDVAIKVRNLSPGGLMAECPGGFVRGDVVEAELRGLGRVAGRVAWTASGRIGLQFDATVDHRLARVRPGEAMQPQIMHHQPVTWRPAVR